MQVPIERLSQTLAEIVGIACVVGLAVLGLNLKEVFH